MGLTAITLAYPVSALIGAIGTGLGLAGAIRFTILSAQGEEEQTRECFSGTTLLILLAGVLLTALLFLAYVRITTAYFYAAEKTALSYLLVYAEPVCTLLLLLALPPVLGLNGVWLAVPLAQTVTFVIALIAKRRVDRGRHGSVRHGLLWNSVPPSAAEKEEGKESNQWVGTDPLVTPSSTQRSGTARKRKKERI